METFILVLICFNSTLWYKHLYFLLLPVFQQTSFPEAMLMGGKVTHMNLIDSSFHYFVEIKKRE